MGTEADAEVAETTSIAPEKVNPITASTMLLRSQLSIASTLSRDLFVTCVITSTQRIGKIGGT